MSISDPRVSPHHKFSDWTSIDFSNEQEWLKAIDIVEDRIRGRFVAPIHKLIPEEFSGFAIIALDCLLIESLNGFKEGRASKGNCEEYAVFFASSPHFKHEFSADVASEFCRSVRNGLIHDSETRHQWFIEKTKPSDRILGHDHLGNYVLNRNHFHVALEAELNDWLARLRGGHHDARQKMRVRMDQILMRHTNTGR